MLHVIKSLKRNGKAAIILPHGVLFRGNAEAVIRKSLVDIGYIKGIIGLPANLFYGTGIPACIVVIDKAKHKERDGTFIIDASRDFIKDGNKNRLRERDVYKITTVFNQRIELDKYSRFVSNDEIKEKNNYNLNIPRYIDGSLPEDLQNIDGHLKGGMPKVDVESLSLYWNTFPNLKKKLFKPIPNRKNFYSLSVEKDVIRDTIYNDADFSEYAKKVESAFENWKTRIDAKLRTINNGTKAKLLIAEIAEVMIDIFSSVSLVDKYDAYEVLFSYWNNIMSDDVYLLIQDDYKAIRDIEVFSKTTAKKNKDGTEVKKTMETGWDGKLVSKTLVIEMFFSAEQKLIADTEILVEALQVELDEMIENVGEDSAINDVLKDNGNLDKAELKAKLKDKTLDEEERAELQKLSDLIVKVDERRKTLRDLYAILDKKVREHYGKLSDGDCLELLLERKWYRSIRSGVFESYEAVCHRISARVAELAERYEQTLCIIEKDVN
jgi:type I restriction enzyme M protein